VSQYCSNVFKIRSGVVDDEKLIKIISMSLTILRVAIKVMVFPDPGGPHSKNGLFSLSQEKRTS
jgi:hypothetical protein